MQIMVNGERRELASQPSIAALLASLGLKAGATMVQRNEDIIERSRYEDTLINDGDKLELVRFIGGG